jgi:pyridoxal phosphate enzyme (YggS family)
VPLEVLREAAAVGVTRFGENRVQDALPKISALPDAEWHLVGTLQANKARRAVQAFAVIQSVDSLELARRLERLAGELGRQARIYLQVNVDDDPAKGGFQPDELERTFDDLVAMTRLRVDGLMTVGRLVASAQDARSTFRRLRTLSERLQATSSALGHGLSMGMTDDFEVAIEEGASLVRVGRAIFGERPAA